MMLEAHHHDLADPPSDPDERIGRGRVGGVDHQHSEPVLQRALRFGLVYDFYEARLALVRHPDDGSELLCFFLTELLVLLRERSDQVPQPVRIVHDEFVQIYGRPKLSIPVVSKLGVLQGRLGVRVRLSLFRRCVGRKLGWEFTKAEHLRQLLGVVSDAGRDPRIGATDYRVRIRIRVRGCVAGTKTTHGFLPRANLVEHTLSRRSDRSASFRELSPGLEALPGTATHQKNLRKSMNSTHATAA